MLLFLLRLACNHLDRKQGPEKQPKMSNSKHYDFIVRLSRVWLDGIETDIVKREFLKLQYCVMFSLLCKIVSHRADKRMEQKHANY